MNFLITALLIMSVCPEAVRVNKSSLPWNDTDTENLLTASKGCKNLYGEKYCLARLVKTGFQEYRAYCYLPSDGNGKSLMTVNRFKRLNDLKIKDLKTKDLKTGEDF